MPTKGLTPLILVLAVAGPAAAEVKSVVPNGFEIASAVTIAAPADRVYSALGEVGRWWDPSQSALLDHLTASLPHCSRRSTRPTA